MSLFLNMSIMLHWTTEGGRSFHSHVTTLAKKNLVVVVHKLEKKRQIYFKKFYFNGFHYKNKLFMVLVGQ